MSTFIAKKQKSAKSNSEPSSNGSSPPASVNLTNGNNMNHVSNNNNLNAANNNNNNAPKYGTLVPNRVFVGGISSTTTETELCQLFSKYGNVKATKIIADRAGVSKGYGFVTFETDEEAKRLQLDADNIILKERRLNIAPAIIKQAFPPRGFEATASPPPMTQQVYFQNGVPYTYQNGMAFFLTPQSQPAPLPAAPDASMFPGAGYAPTQGPSQTYAPAMMYPCANPAPMFISPQYPQYQPMPMSNQSAQLMYTTTNLQTSNNGADATSPIPMSSHGTAPYYVSHGEMRQEVFYNMPPGPNQGYPYSAPPLMMTNLHDPTIQYCDLSSEQPNNNVPNEVVQQPIPDENLPPQDQTDPNPDATNHENSEQPQRSRINSETPIVSLRNLQKIEDSDSNRGGRFRNNNRQGGDNRHNRFSNAANNNTSQGGEVNVNDRGAWQRRNRGGGRGGASMAVTIPKYPFNNNNNPSVANNNNYTKTGDMQQGNMQGRGGYRGANVGNRGSYRMNHQNGRRVITRSSTPSPNDPYNNSFSNPNITVHTSTQFQVAQPHPQPFIQGRNVQLTYHPGVAAAGGNSMPHVHAYAAAHHPSAHPPPPIQQQLHQSSVPSRRFASTTNRRNNQNNNTHQSSTKKRGDIDNGAAGDAPVQNLITPPTTPAISKGSPSPTVSSSDQELICSGVKNLSVQ